MEEATTAKAEKRISEFKNKMAKEEVREETKADNSTDEVMI